MSRAVADQMDPVDPLLLVDDFSYELPADLIAQTPLDDRSASRLLVVDRATGSLTHSSIRDLGQWLAPGDVLVANNSRVLPARLRGIRADTGGRVELLLLRREAAGRWSALAKPARRLRPGTRLALIPRAGGDRIEGNAEVVEQGTAGEVLVQLDDTVETELQRFGTVPLPPYITANLEQDERYQTVYASAPGSAAAPTAGLHLTDELIQSLQAAGITWAEVTLHVGLDTFRPVTVGRVADHVIHREWCMVPDETALAVAEAKQAGRRVVAVGTTAARTLETLGRYWRSGGLGGITGMTSIFIVPGYDWHITDAMLTNFHLPRSTLMMMVSSLAGSELMRRAYGAAIADRYRFFSFGDAMLIR